MDEEKKQRREEGKGRGNEKDRKRQLAKKTHSTNAGEKGNGTGNKHTSKKKELLAGGPERGLPHVLKLQFSHGKVLLGTFDCLGFRFGSAGAVRSCEKWGDMMKYEDYSW